jgi:glycine/D-amino acid oxidase-like deaminating enzyme
MRLSYWEYKSWFSQVDYTVVGSGIVGLHAALRLRERFPAAKILVLEKGVLPEGASTKNAGFACFGSLSELLDDLRSHSEDEVINLVHKRWNGLQLLRKNLGDEALDFTPHGGYELFLQSDANSYANCLARMPFINDLFRPFFKADVFLKEYNRFGFQGLCDQLIFNPFEAQIDTGKMMQALLKKAISQDILILNQQEVLGYTETNLQVEIQLLDFSFATQKLFFATNGFASQLLDVPVQPGRAQVLVTEPIPNLAIKGTFHLDQGYYYFRNIDDRILLGGGRNLDFVGETTTDLGQTDLIQNRLEELLKEVILPQQDVKVALRWSGIMGLGAHKNPIVEQLSNRVYCGVRLGGMGVAIGSLIGAELADLA